MKQLSSEKYNIAWFKLAEFVSRGEKERALSLYRLLVHSFDDRALAYQLEGDLLLAFNDYQLAQERYRFAAQLYQKNEQKIQAALMYEQLILLEVTEEYLSALVSLYDALSIISRLMYYAAKLIEIMIQKNEIERCVIFITEFEQKYGVVLMIPLYKHATITAIKKNVSEHIVLQVLQKTIQGLLCINNSTDLSSFLVTLQAVDQRYYEAARTYI